MAERVEEFQIDDRIANDAIDLLKKQFMCALNQKEVKILMYGKGKAGKTSLARALAGGRSSGGTHGPVEGTVKIGETQYGHVTVYNTQGLLAGREKVIVAEMKKRCDPATMDGVIICQNWNAPFEKKNLEILHHLDPNVWGKVVFALTRCDELPPEIQSKHDGEKKTEIKKIKQEWERQIQATLRRLKVGDTVVQTIQVVFTTHTEIENNGTFNWTLYGESDDYSTVKKMRECISNNARNVVELSLRAAIGLDENGEWFFSMDIDIESLFQDPKIREAIRSLIDSLACSNCCPTSKSSVAAIISTGVGAIAGGGVAGVIVGLLITVKLGPLIAAIAVGAAIGGVVGYGLNKALASGRKEKPE